MSYSKNLSVIVGFMSLSEVSEAALVLTEVDLATGVIEITNTDSSAFSGTLLEWCRPFQYGTLESGGFSFAAGESRVYGVSAIGGILADDFWIYLDRTGGFGDESVVTTGIVFGSNQAGMGRVNNVVADTGGAAWADASDFVDTAGLGAGPGLTLQLDPFAPLSNTSANWSIGPSNFGSYVIPEPSASALVALGLFGLLGRRSRRT